MHIVISYETDNEWSEQNVSKNFAMLNLCNRSLAFHMIEQIMKIKEHCENDTDNIISIEKITFICDDNPSLLRSHLGSGERWGCRIDVISTLISLDYTIDVITYSQLMYQSQNILIFTQLSIFNPYHCYIHIKNLLSDSKDVSNQDKKAKIHETLFFISKKTAFSPICIPCFEIQNIQDIARATVSALDDEFPWLLREEREDNNVPMKPSPEHRQGASGIFLGAQCTIAPSARIYAPSIIGHNVHIGALATIGPYACIGDSCIIDENASIKNSTIYNNTYISPLVAIKESYVVGKSITQIESNVCIIAPSALIKKNTNDNISSYSKENARKVCFLKKILCTTLFWVLIWVIFLCLSPIVLLQWLLGGRRFEKLQYKEYDEVKTLECKPTLKKIKNSVYRVHATAPKYLQGPIMSFFPSILNVLFKDISIFGSSLAKQDCRQTIQWLQEKNIDISEHNKVGLLPPWLGLGKAPMTPIEKHIHSMWYTQKCNACVDCKILFGLMRYGFGHYKQYIAKL